ncbi:MAG: MFS transporter, partial [candidate division WOR-3 bacterium]
MPPICRSRNLLFLTASSLVSQFGDRLTHMVIVTFIGIYSPGQIAAFSEFSFSFTLPVIIFAPIAGVVVDHLSRRAVICNIHIIQASILALTPLFIHLTGSMLPIWFVVFLFFGLDVFNNSARAALIPSIVRREDILQANSILIFGLRIATFGGMVLGGLLIDWVGWHLGFYLDGL